MKHTRTITLADPFKVRGVGGVIVTVTHAVELQDTDGGEWLRIGFAPSSELARIAARAAVDGKPLAIGFDPVAVAPGDPESMKHVEEKVRALIANDCGDPNCVIHGHPERPARARDPKAN